MKLSDVRPCDNCGKGLAPHGFFYVLRVSYAFIAPKAFNATMGLTQMFGGAVRLAQAMSPDPEVIKIAGDENPELMTELLLCQDCVLMQDLSIAYLMEKRNIARREPPAKDGA